MATTPLAPDFGAFLRSLSEHDVRYLLVGGYAVAYHGYVRSTADLDVWVPRDRSNSTRLVESLREFGFDLPEIDADLFLRENRIVRLGNPPMRIEIHTSLSGVEFHDCYERRIDATWDDLEVSVIARGDLITNKRAAGRHQDLADLEHLE